MTTRPTKSSAACGVVGLALLATALFLPGAPPRTSDSVAHLTRVLVDRHDVLLVGTWLAGLGALVFLWFLGALHRFLRVDAGSEVEATVAVGGGLGAVLLMLVGISMSSALALGSSRANDDALVRAATDLGNILIELGKFGLAALILATCLAARRAAALSDAQTAVGAATAVLLVASALPPFLADHGFWEFGGPPEVLGGLPAIAWVVWLSVALARRAEPSA